MEDQISEKRFICLLLLGMLGSALMAASDWLMIYGDPGFTGALPWLTAGVAQVSPFRNAFAMAIAFPAVIFCCFGLFSVRYFLKGRQRKTYCALTAAGITPWLCLHLFYIMIFFLFSWLNAQGESMLCHTACEAVFAQFHWIIPVGEGIMVLPYIYLLCLTATGKTRLPKQAVLNNPLFLFAASAVKCFLPESAWKLAYTNGMMSLAVFVWFFIYIPLIRKNHI